MCKHDDGCNAPEGECSGACMKQGETLDQLCERYPAVKALREDNAKAWGMARSTSQLSIDERKMREHIAALESQLAELRQGGEAVGEVVLESMGVGDAKVVRFHMYKEIPPVGTKLYTQPAIPPGYVVVPEADPHYVAARILSTLGFAQDVSKEPGADRRRDKIAEMIEECFNTADGGRVRHSISMPEGLHPDTAKLVKRFARALANKLHAAEKKYGYDNGWMRPDWMDECREHLMKHIAKGDPRDVAAYCAFLWHHDASTASAPAIQPQAAAPVDERVAKDAARYRYLTSIMHITDNNHPICKLYDALKGEVPSKEQLDAAIDAAMLAAPADSKEGE